MKKLCLFLSALSVLCLLSACAPHRVDWFEGFRAGFEAEVTGEVCGEHFSARVEAEAVTAEGVLPLTVTFYAPQALAGTVLARDASGNISLTCGDMVLREGLGALTVLLDCFPIAGAIEGAALNEAGHTEVRSGAFCVEYLSDGTPFALRAGETVLLTVLRWQND